MLFEQMYGKRPHLELFNIKQDPFEMHNLAGEEQYAALEEELTKSLLNEMQRTGDPRLIREGEFYETPPMAGPLKEKSPGWKNQKRKP